MAPLFSTVDFNKLWHDVQNEETLIYAKFGKDLFNISKVIGRKKWHSFFDSQCMLNIIYLDVSTPTGRLEVFIRRMKISLLHPVLGTVSSRCAKTTVVCMTELVAALLTYSD